uniref:BPTI/Kunitz inhibitor domain-containing protein n=1 Tax=Podarcis muralis TaxID=64176 RepID=A0A670K6L4_PODMU
LPLSSLISLFSNLCQLSSGLRVLAFLCFYPPDGLPDKCKLPKNVGRCKASFTRFFFNVETLKCEEFIFGGCKANENNFLNENECYQECGRFGKNK